MGETAQTIREAWKGILSCIADHTHPRIDFEKSRGVWDPVSGGGSGGEFSFPGRCRNPQLQVVGS